MTVASRSIDSALYEALLRVTFDAAFIVDETSWRVVAFNPAAATLWSGPADLLIGMALETLLGLDGLGSVERAVWRAQQEGDPAEFDFETARGDRKHVTARARRCEFADGAVFLLVLHDVTRERDLVEKLESALVERRVLLDGLGIGMLVLDAGGRVIWHNRFEPFEDLFGETLTGRNFFLDIAPPDAVRPVFQRFHTWWHDTQNQPYEERFELEIGRRLFSAELRVGSGAFGGAGLVRLADVSERRTAEEQLRRQTFQAQEATRYTGLVFQTVSVIHGSLDLNDVLATAVSETGRLLGASRCQVLEFAPDGTVRLANEYARPGLEPLTGLHPAVDKSPVVAEALRVLHPLALERVEGHPLADRVGLLGASGAEACIVAPITVRREPRGALAVEQCDRARRWIGPEVDLVGAIATQVGLAIHHAEIHTRLRRQADREAVVSRLAASLHGANDLDEAVANAVGILMGATQARRCLVAPPGAAKGAAPDVRSFRREGEGRFVEDPESNARTLHTAILGLTDLATPDVHMHGSPDGCRIYSVALTTTRQADRDGVLAVEMPAGSPAWDEDARALLESAAVHIGIAAGTASVMQAVVGAKRMWEGTFDAMSDGIVVHDEGMRIVRVNRAFARLVRSGPARLVGRGLGDLLEAGNVAALERACARVTSARRPETLEIDDPNLGGSVSISLSRLRTKGGAFFIQTLRDITDERHMQERLAQASKMASIGHLAAGVAHEINTPLATITGCAQSLVRQLNAVPELTSSERWEAVAERLTTIVEQSFRCKKITRDLLDYAKPTKPTFVATDLDRIAREAVETVGRDRVLGRVRTRAVGDAAAVFTDPDLIRQVVVNLLVNALDAVEAAGSSGEVLVETRYLKRATRLTIHDSGAGIAPGDLDRIFDPFFTTKPPGRGTGLGLSISQSIVASLGGRIDVSSTPGRGSRFSVVLPKGSERTGRAGVLGEGS